jgi:ubiquinone/menaquinone biosynthesis C-methylase UbiE
MIFRKFLLINERVCPWWLMPTFDNPLRRLVQNPDTILNGLVEEGQTVLDIGCGMGYFTIPLARMVDVQGRVIAVDLQEKMLEGVRRRAVRAGMLDRIQMQQAKPNSLEVSGPVDFALAFWMVHEVPDRQAFLNEVKSLLKPGGGFLIVEPRIHVSAEDFQKTIHMAQAAGLVTMKDVKVNLSQAILLHS